jgi:hypothetical protein
MDEREFALQAEGAALFEERPIRHHMECVRLDCLELGFQGEKVDFSYRERSVQTDKPFAALRASIRANGLRWPVVTYQQHVLIGMRRVAILRELWMPHFIVPCYELDEDVHEYTRDDILRLEAWKRIIYPDYEEFLS